ncbi:hypothetical protein S245_001639, partial [Arachis hypogaea]
MRSAAVRWTTKAAVAEGRGGVASSSGILATVATAGDGSPGYHAFDHKQKTERVAGSGALGQQFRDSNLDVRLIYEFQRDEDKMQIWQHSVFGAMYYIIWVCIEHGHDEPRNASSHGLRHQYQQ